MTERTFDQTGPKLGGTSILVVDDEPQIHRFLEPALRAAGYLPIRAERGREGLRLAVMQAPSLILLDLGLPDMDGKLVLEELRRFSAAPVLILSARDKETEKVAALDLGADDYVEKPFALAELLARIRAALRRGSSLGSSPVQTLRLGQLELNLEHRSANVDGDPLRLTPREWELLVTLMRSRGRVMTHRQLLNIVWGPAHTGDAQYVRVYVGHLRAKLGKAAALLHTEAGLGYRFEERS